MRMKKIKLNKNEMHWKTFFSELKSPRNNDNIYKIMQTSLASLMTDNTNIKAELKDINSSYKYEVRLFWYFFFGYNL